MVFETGHEKDNTIYGIFVKVDGKCFCFITDFCIKSSYRPCYNLLFLFELPSLFHSIFQAVKKSHGLNQIKYLVLNLKFASSYDY